MKRKSQLGYFYLAMVVVLIISLLSSCTPDVLTYDQYVQRDVDTTTTFWVVIGTIAAVALFIHYKKDNAS